MSAVAIISGLEDSLNMDAGDLALNLQRLYDYINSQLMEANAHNDANKVDESMRLLTEIKTAWDAIRTQALTHHL